MQRLPSMKGWLIVHTHDEGYKCNFIEYPCYYRPTTWTQVKALLRAIDWRAW